MRPLALSLRQIAGLPRLAITPEQFAALGEYSTSIPTGVFLGKLWRCRLANGRWVVRGYRAYDDEIAEVITWKPRFTVRTGALVVEMANQWRDSLVRASYGIGSMPDPFRRIALTELSRTIAAATGASFVE